MRIVSKKQAARTTRAVVPWKGLDDLRRRGTVVLLSESHLPSHLRGTPLTFSGERTMDVRVKYIRVLSEGRYKLVAQDDTKNKLFDTKDKFFHAIEQYFVNEFVQGAGLTTHKDSKEVDGDGEMLPEDIAPEDLERLRIYKANKSGAESGAESGIESGSKSSGKSSGKGKSKSSVEGMTCLLVQPGGWDQEKPDPVTPEFDRGKQHLVLDAKFFTTDEYLKIRQPRIRVDGRLKIAPFDHIEEATWVLFNCFYDEPGSDEERIESGDEPGDEYVDSGDDGSEEYDSSGDDSGSEEDIDGGSDSKKSSKKRRSGGSGGGAKKKTKRERELEEQLKASEVQMKQMQRQLDSRKRKSIGSDGE
jgi:hypothetical protein